MGRYIDADALKKWFREEYKYGEIEVPMQLEMIINYFPEADVEPVRHGHWIEHTNELNKYCSECKRINGDIYHLDKYCPNCGAKMDEEVEQ